MRRAPERTESAIVTGDFVIDAAAHFGRAMPMMMTVLASIGLLSGFGILLLKRWSLTVVQGAALGSLVVAGAWIVRSLVMADESEMAGDRKRDVRHPDLREPRAQKQVDQDLV